MKFNLNHILPDKEQSDDSDSPVFRATQSPREDFYGGIVESFLTKDSNGIKTLYSEFKDNDDKGVINNFTPRKSDTKKLAINQKHSG